jgi:hypothetical protein
VYCETTIGAVPYGAAVHRNPVENACVEKDKCISLVHESDASQTIAQGVREDRPPKQEGGKL